MRRRIGMLLVLTLSLWAGAVLAGNQVIGTVEMELDGTPQTWYVVQPDGGLMPSAVWVAAGPNRGMISIAAYPDADIELVREERMGSSVPAGESPVLIVGIAFPLGAEQQTYTIPSDRMQIASVMLLDDWSEPLGGYQIDSGEVRLSRIDAHQDSDSSFAGTFSGVLRRDEDTRTVQRASFQVDRVPFVAPGNQ